MPKKESRDLKIGRQYQLAGIISTQSHHGVEPSYEERQRALAELKAFPNLHPQVLQTIASRAPFEEHREWARRLLPKAPAPAMASAGGRK